MPTVDDLPLMQIWDAIPRVLTKIEKIANRYDKVLELGPGPNPFPAADIFIDFQNFDELQGEPCSKVDLNYDPFPPFVEGTGFIYTRHLLEDLHNPKNMLDEIQNTCEVGYIETPSPYHELSRQVDQGRPYLGYYHHFWIIWTEGDTLCLIPKLGGFLEHTCKGSKSPFPYPIEYFNNYYLFEKGLKYKIYALHQDIGLYGKEYNKIVEHAVIVSGQHTKKFLS